MPEWITKYWLEWIFGIGIAALTGLYKRLSAQLKQERKESEALRDGMRALLKRQIVEDCESALRDGWCSTNRKNAIGAMYDSYHTLGGNGGVTELKDQMMRLPGVEPEKREAIS